MMDIKLTSYALLLINAGLFSANSNAYDKDLLDNPINLGVSVEPNILLLLDDSSSMNESYFIDKRARLAYKDSAEDRQNLSVLSDNPGQMNFTPDSDTDLLALCAAVNVFAYDPNKTYRHWPGVDDDGEAFEDQTLATARDNPYLSTGSTTDLRDHFYLVPSESALITDPDTQKKVLPDTYKVIDPDSTDEDVDASEDGIDGICGPLLRAYEEIPSYLMGFNTTSEENKGLLVDSGGPGENGEGNYSLNSRFRDNDFTISNSGSTTTTLSFPEGIILASDGIASTDNIDQLRIYADDKVGSPVFVFPDLSTATVVTETRQVGGVDTPYNVYTNIPGELVVNSSRVIIEFKSDQTFASAEGFVIGWNLSGNDYPNKVNRIISKKECKSKSANCKVVSELDSAKKTNYANWYSYYRNKDLVVKSSLSQIIDGLETQETVGGVTTTVKQDPLEGRVGLAVINKPVQINGAGVRQSGVGKIISDISEGDRRNELLAELYQILPLGRTPLREALENAGEYFTQGNGDTSVTNLFGGDTAHDSSETLASDTPILSEDNGGYCQSNYTLLFTDGVWSNDGGPSVGNTDADGPGVWDDHESFRDDEGSPISDSLADVAMHYFERDLSSSLDNEVQEFDSRFDNTRKIDHQHMVTSAISFGVEGKIPFENPRSDFPFDPLASDFPGWGDNKVDDLAHAAWNSRGSYYSATTPEQVQTAFENSINNLTQTIVTASAGSLNTSSLDAGAVAFSSFYNSDKGHGEVRSYIFDEGDLADPNDDRFVYSPDNAINGLTSWSADKQLGITQPTDRQIITFGASAPTPFTPTNINNLSALQVADLSNGNDDAYAGSVIDYLRGVENISAGFRSRITSEGNDGGENVKHLLGPIINSTPVYVDASSDGYPNNIESTTYSSYLTDKETQYESAPLLFVGANDGMLHAFNALDGKEVFAYVPSPKILENRLHDITSPTYTNQAYVDGAMVSADVFVSGSTTSTTASWKTYLVGGLRTGGKGLYALDITNRQNLIDAQSNASSILKWEFSHKELGYTFSQPQIAKMNASIDGGSSWGVIVGNGYGVSNDCGLQDDGTYEDSNGRCGKASLFIIDINDPSKFEILETDTSLDGGSVDFSSTLNDKCVSTASDCNGLSSPALVDIDGDNIVDRIYAGDLHGNMWVFDVSNKTSSDNWGVDNAKPLFEACRGSNCAEKQSITARPVVTRHPTQLLGDNAPNLMVYFGTGQLIDENDQADNKTQSFYGVWDSGNGSTERGLRIDKLQQQTITNIDSNGEMSRNITQERVDYSTQFGWYMDLPGDGTGINPKKGERVIASAIPVGDIIFFLTVNPNDAFCSAGGVSYLMGVNAVDGSNATFDVFNRFTGTDRDVEEAAIRYDGIGTGIGITKGKDGNPQIVKSGSDGTVVTERSDTGGISSRAGRKAWSIIH